MSATAAFLERARSQAELRETPRIWLPASAVKGGRVAVIDGNRVVLRPVSIGAMHGDRVEIISGVSAGERVVVSPRGLRDGGLVRVSS